LDSIIRAVEAQTQDLKSTLAGMKDIIQNVEVTKHQRNATSNGGGIDNYQKGTGDVCDGFFCLQVFCLNIFSRSMELLRIQMRLHHILCLALIA
jgi:hypothetical protein